MVKLTILLDFFIFRDGLNHRFSFYSATNANRQLNQPVSPAGYFFATQQLQQAQLPAANVPKKPMYGLGIVQRTRTGKTCTETETGEETK